ncbi:hypothetical protein OsI_36321 [Oryza sativa Indica Group]|uniref:Uncharacterized protein n=1 Tax=Oryza sativa subsp. indica TaxID=39946 RepID=B8BKU3_ORYSI|nr:hypothetical protein OsI_36321 [Oryza sativa Indica Group]
MHRTVIFVKHAPLFVRSHLGLCRTYFIVYTLSESSVYTQEPSRQIMCLMHQITFLLHGFYLLRVKQLGEPLEFLPLYPASK